MLPPAPMTRDAASSLVGSPRHRMPSGVDGVVRAGASDGLKRLLDIAIASLLLVVLSPLVLLACAAIVTDSPGRPIYRQWRCGRRGIPFRIWKLRTMRVAAHVQRTALLADNGSVIFKLPNDWRATRVGAILRKFSIDELPQLVNVISGDMSLVGPRPFSLEIFERLPMGAESLAVWCHVRHSVRPGMTGLWQVSGRNDLSDAELIALDLQYVRQRSLMLDLSILLRTLPAVARHRGAY